MDRAIHVQAWSAQSARAGRVSAFVQRHWSVIGAPSHAHMQLFVVAISVTHPLPIIEQSHHINLTNTTSIPSRCCACCHLRIVHYCYSRVVATQLLFASSTVALTCWASALIGPSCELALLCCCTLWYAGCVQASWCQIAFISHTIIIIILWSQVHAIYVICIWNNWYWHWWIFWRIYEIFTALLIMVFLAWQACRTAPRIRPRLSLTQWMSPCGCSKIGCYSGGRKCVNTSLVPAHPLCRFDSGE